MNKHDQDEIDTRGDNCLRRNTGMLIEPAKRITKVRNKSTTEIALVASCKGNFVSLGEVFGICSKAVQSVYTVYKVSKWPQFGSSPFYDDHASLACKTCANNQKPEFQDNFYFYSPSPGPLTLPLRVSLYPTYINSNSTLYMEWEMQTTALENKERKRILSLFAASRRRFETLILMSDSRIIIKIKTPEKKPTQVKTGVSPRGESRSAVCNFFNQTLNSSSLNCKFILKCKG